MGKTYVRAKIAQLTAYQPGEQPSADSKVIKLNTNECAGLPAPEVMQAISSVSGQSLVRYPSPDSRGFCQVAGGIEGLTHEHVLATNGGDELLRMLIQACCEPEQGVSGGLGLLEPTYTLYEVLAKAHGTSITMVDRLSAEQHFAMPDPVLIAKQWNEAGCALGIVVNPHAPSGGLATVAQLKELADAFDGLLLIDEAYVDFASNSAIELVQQGSENVILLRTMSKGYGLAGLRFGYGLGHPNLIADLHKIRDSYNCDVISQAAATAALNVRENYYMPIWKDTIEQRERLINKLTEIQWSVMPSHSNFILAKPPEKMGLHASEIYAALKVRGLLVRWFNRPVLDDWLRISIGDANTMRRLVTELDDIAAGASGTGFGVI